MSSVLHESVLGYRGRRWLWVASGLALVAALAYAWHDPPAPPGGSTWLGYTLGTAGALLILLLIGYGVRKRSYRSRLGRVQGWLSAHIYLGTALLVIVTLHTGFQLGANVHTLAYVLMCVVIASGFVGTAFYLRYPARMSAGRGGSNRETLAAEIADLDQKAAQLARDLPADYQALVASTRDRAVLGGDALALLSGADRSRVVLPGSSGGAVPNPALVATLHWLTDRLARNQDPALAPRLQDLVTLLSARRAAAEQLRADLRLQAWLEVWLYCHVPVAFALLAALIAHVFSVFVYW